MNKQTRQQPLLVPTHRTVNPRQTGRPQAPPPYRPQVVPQCLQPKAAQPRQPPFSVPQPTPKVLPRAGGPPPSPASRGVVQRLNEDALHEIAPLAFTVNDVVNSAAAGRWERARTIWRVLRQYGPGYRNVNTRMTALRNAYNQVVSPHGVPLLHYVNVLGTFPQFVQQLTTQAAPVYNRLPLPQGGGGDGGGWCIVS